MYKRERKFLVHLWVEYLKLTVPLKVRNIHFIILNFLINAVENR